MGEKTFLLTKRKKLAPFYRCMMCGTFFHKKAWALQCVACGDHRTLMPDDVVKYVPVSNE